MHRERIDTAPEVLDTGYTPSQIINRDHQLDTLQHAFANPGSQHLYLHGPRGTGKTLVTRAALDAAPDHCTATHISCIQHDTQYRVLRRLYQSITGDDINHGYHTAQLQQRIQDLVDGQDLIIVLDDIDYLLENDGNDLLYFLSRINADANITLVAISANHTDPRSVIGQRALSSMQPVHVPFDRYPAEQAYDILEARLREGEILDTVDRDALTYLVTRTRNIQLGLHWLAQAASTTEHRITVDLLQNCASAATQRYRDALLTAFTTHHHLLYEAISQLHAEHGDAVRSGLIYDRYTELCQSTGTDALCQRRVGDFLTHLELLGIIDVEHRYGGANGRTREVRLTAFL